MSEHDDLEQMLTSMGAAPAPAPDAEFVRSLEVRLSATDAGAKVAPLVRRTRRLGVVGLAAGTLAFAGVAAAAGVVITRPFQDDEPPATTTVVTTVPPTVAVTTSLAPTTTEPVTTVPGTEPPTVAPTAPPTTVPVTLPQTVPPTEPPRTVPTTEPPATTTTEVRTPATITLECVVVDAVKVRCSWSPGPDGTAKYQVLRSTPGGTTGRAYEVGLDAGNTWLDPVTAPGVTASYVVWAVDAGGKGIAHSTLITVNCC